MISVLIPVYNEEEILEKSAFAIYDYLSSRKIDFELIVTSNGSTDSTDTIGTSLAQKNSWFRFFTLPTRSVGKAFTKGVTEARSEYIISLDADLSFELTFLEYAKTLLDHGDIVVGSKTMGRQRRSFIRVLGSQLYILLTQLLFNLTISDFSIGCKAYKKSAILPLLSNIDEWTGYVLDICIALSKSGKKIIQIGVDCEDTRKSHFNLLHEGFYRYLHLWRAYKKQAR